MTRAMDALKRFFPSGTAEGERSILENVFIMPAQMIELLTIHQGNPRILVGNKGTGKTALIDYVGFLFLQHKVPCVSLRPDELDLRQLRDEGDMATIRRVMYESLLKAVETKFFEAGHLSQPKQESSFLVRVQNLIDISQPLTRELRTTLIQKISASGRSSEDVKSALESSLFSDDCLSILLLDDTDQIASPDYPSQLNRIWGFLLAVRQLAMKVTHLKIIISLRSEIWRRLQRDERGQRDQIDHFGPLVVDLRTNDPYLESILNRRIESAAATIGYQGSDPVLQFFDSNSVQLPSSNETRRWGTFITKSSRERPRDMIQLVGKLIDCVRRNRGQKITSRDADAVMHEYSEERVNYMATEVGSDCAEFKEVVRSFYDLPYEMSFEELRKHLEALPSRFSVAVKGRTLRPHSPETVIALLDILFEAGFVNARIMDTRMSREFRHITHADDPQMIRRSRWNDLQSAQWEVHPAFRTFLLDIKKQSMFR